MALIRSVNPPYDTGVIGATPNRLLKKLGIKVLKPRGVRGRRRGK